MKLPITTLLRIAAYCIHGRFTKPRVPEYNAELANSSLYSNPHDLFKRIRRDQPVFFSEKTASWHIAGPYQLVADLLTDERLSSRFIYWRFAPDIPEHKKGELDRVLDNLLTNIDKKSHMRIRKLASPAFSPRMVAKCKPMIEEVVARHLDQVDVSRPFNICELTRAIPMEIVARFIGVPKSSFAHFRELSNAIVATYMPSVKFDEAMALQGLTVVKDLVNEKKNNPGDDFLSVLISNVEDGDRISAEEALALAMSALAAGPETTKDYIDYAIYSLIRNQDVLQKVLADKELLGTAMLEALRWDHFAHGGPVRFALEDIDIHGQCIQKGEMVKLLVPFIQHDETVFPEPEKFKLDRKNKGDIIRYGLGNHYCLGAALANVMAETVVWNFFQRFPNVEVDGKIVHESHFAQRRMSYFPVTA